MLYSGVVGGDLFFCFYKQKTAYEVRISDWSSDVCSSDLGGGSNRLLWGAVAVVLLLAGGLVLLAGMRDDAGDTATADTAAPAETTSTDAPDRQRVVLGKSVSVRVDLGGRRITKQNQEYHNACDRRQTQLNV